MRETITVCNFCRIQKKETNAWFKIYLLDRDGDNKPTGILVVEAQVTTVNSFANMGAFKLPAKPDADACGRGCVTKGLSLWMETGSLEPPQLVGPCDGNCGQKGTRV